MLAAALVLIVVLGIGTWLVVRALTPDQQAPSATATPAPSAPPAAAAPGATATVTPMTPAAPGTTSQPANPNPGASGGAGLDIENSSSLQVLVNKHHPLQPAEYVPRDLVSMESIGVPSSNGHSLRREAAEAIKRMFAAAKEDANLRLDMTSGYRSADLQRRLYDGYVRELGQKGADATSARPGSSEHQTGLAADISTIGGDCSLAGCYGNEPGGKWLRENSWRYGFILRYDDGQTPVTGYEYEPWHFRFIGVEAAKRYHDSGAKTYEGFVGSEAAPTYSG